MTVLMMAVLMTQGVKVCRSSVDANQPSIAMEGKLNAEVLYEEKTS
jgi:hypothetical protein